MKKMYFLLFLFLGIFSYTNAQTTSVTTGLPSSASSGSGANYYITFVLQNTNSYPITITAIDMYRSSGANGNTFTLFYNPTTLSGPPALPTGWTSITSAVNSNVTTTAIHPTFTNMNFTIPANTTYRFAVQTNGSNLNYGGSATTPNSFINGGLRIGRGNYQINSLNVGYWGPSTNPRFWCGTIYFIPANCSGTPTAGTASAPSSVCPNSSFNLTLTGNTSTSGITIQWQSSPNGTGSWTNIPGATSATQAISGIAATTYYRAVVTCTNSSTSVNSNSVAVALTPTTPPTISISGNATACSGFPVTYTATTNVTGGTIQWKVNGNNVGTNSTIHTYNPANGDVVSATVSTTSNCYSPLSANSNSITMNVTTSTPLTVSISGNSNHCVGDTAIYTATTSITGGSYQWKVNGNNVGTNSSTYAHIASGNFTIQCVVTPPPGCYLPAVGNSNTISVTVYPIISPSITINESSNGVCVGTPVVFTAIGNVNGASYQWKVNNVNVGTNSTSYTYTPNNNDQVTCVLTNPALGCFTANNVVSNTITMGVIPITVPSVTINVDTNNICYGMVSTFTANTNIFGATYQWKVNNQNIGFDTSALNYLANHGDIVICEATIPPGSCYTANGDTSNAVTMNVNNNLPTNISVSGNLEFCKGNPATYTAVTNVPAPNYQWQVNGSNMGTNSPILTYNPTDQDTLTCTITVTTGCFIDPAATSTPIVLSGQAAPTPIMITGTDMFYSNYPIGNKWFRNDTLIYTGLVINIPNPITFPSCYHLENTNYLGCYARTADTCLYPVVTGIPQVLTESEVHIYPNPSSDVFHINSPAENGDYSFELMDITGRKLQTGIWKVRANKIEEKVSVINYADGIYFLAIRNEKSAVIKRLEKR